MLHDKKKVCGILQEIINHKDKKLLIIGIGLNTNFDPKNKGFLSTSLKKIINKDIDNNQVLNKIKNIYEKFLSKVKNHSYLRLKKIYNNL